MTWKEQASQQYECASEASARVQLVEPTSQQLAMQLLLHFLWHSGVRVRRGETFRHRRQPISQRVLFELHASGASKGEAHLKLWLFSYKLKGTSKRRQRKNEPCKYQQLLRNIIFAQKLNTIHSLLGWSLLAFRKHIEIYKYIKDCLYLCMNLCPSFTCKPLDQSQPNSAQTSTPTRERFLTQVWPRQPYPLTLGYPKLQNLYRSLEKKIFALQKKFSGQRLAMVG